MDGRRSRSRVYVCLRMCSAWARGENVGKGQNAGKKDPPRPRPPGTRPLEARQLRVAQTLSRRRGERAPCVTLPRQHRRHDATGHHSLTRSLTHYSLIHSLAHSLAHSLTYLVTHTPPHHLPPPPPRPAGFHSQPRIPLRQRTRSIGDTVDLGHPGLQLIGPMRQQALTRYAATLQAFSPRQVQPFALAGADSARGARAYAPLCSTPIGRAGVTFGHWLSRPLPGRRCFCTVDGHATA